MEKKLNHLRVRFGSVAVLMLAFGLLLVVIMVTQVDIKNHAANATQPAGVGISDTDIQGAVQRAVANNPGSINGPVLFDAAAKSIRSDHEVDWADELVGARMIDAYLAAKAGKELTVSEIRKMDEQTFNNLVQQVAGTVGVSIVAVLNEAYLRVKNSWLPSLEQQVEHLTAQLVELNQQLDTMKQEVTAMKQRIDPLPLGLGIAAFVLAGGAVLLALRKGRPGIRGERL